MINILFFAQLRETLECESLSLPLENARDLDALKTHLQAQGTAWQHAFSSGKVLTAVNQEMQTGNCDLADGDEVAFFPPVTGG